MQDLGPEDDRERASEVIAFLGGIPKIWLRIQRLAAGDYLADWRILFQRKTLQDLAKSIVDGRLFKQMIRLTKSKYKAVLILEGTAKDAECLGVRREALQGAFTTISLHADVQLIRQLSLDILPTKSKNTASTNRRRS